jgi:hypothetical protein
MLNPYAALKAGSKLMNIQQQRRKNRGSPRHFPSCSPCFSKEVKKPNLGKTTTSNHPGGRI